MNVEVEGCGPRTCPAKQGVGDYIIAAQNINPVISEYVLKLYHRFRMEEMASYVWDIHVGSCMQRAKQRN
jgi:hypothetical protein